MSFGSGKIWMNGSLVDWADAKIHIASHVIHYGTGVFEGARCYETPKGAACFRLDAHLRRLLDSGKIYRMESPLDQAGWETAVLDTIRANQLKACYIRPLMYRGYNQLGVNPLPCPVDAAVLVWEWGAYLGPGAENGVDVRVSSWNGSLSRRWSNSSSSFHRSRATAARIVCASRSSGPAIGRIGSSSPSSTARAATAASRKSRG